MVKVNEETIEKWSKLCEAWLRENGVSMHDVETETDAWITFHSAVMGEHNPLVGYGLTDIEWLESIRWAMAQIFTSTNIYSIQNKGKLL